jgi:hypothetical protein
LKSTLTRAHPPTPPRVHVNVPRGAGVRARAGDIGEDLIVPYKDPQQQRDYHRDYARLRRTPVCQTPGTTPLPSEFRLRTANDVIELLAEQIDAVRQDADVGTVERARTIGYLLGLALKAVETADLTDRLEAMERVLKGRKEGEACNEKGWPANTIS